MMCYHRRVQNLIRLFITEKEAEMKRIIKRTLILLAAVICIITAVVFAVHNQKDHTVLQNENTVRDDVITAVHPVGVFTAYEGQKIEMRVTALSGARVSVRVGAKKYDLKEKENEKSAYSTYTKTVKMPGSQIEIESVGTIVVTAVYQGNAYTLNSAQVRYVAKPETLYTTENTTENTTLPAENYVSQDVTAASSVSTVTAATLPSLYTPSTSSPGFVAGVSDKMCVVTAGTADTWPGGTNDDSFVPYYSPLIRGTVDYIVSQSEVYDGEEGEMRYFYNLASGRRVQRKNVEVMDKTDMGDNSISVLSSYASGGTLTVVLGQKWKSAFSSEITNQQYYSAYGKKYNVSSFTGTSLKLTFYHTVSANGTIDCTGSDIISGAQWSVDPSAKTATLTMQFRSQGVYFGYSAAYDANGNLILTVHNKPQSLAGSVILLDPGHGGTDSGAVGYGGQIPESQMNFANAVALKDELEKRGATVYLTRYDDIKLTLEERKEMIYSLKPDLYISIHTDGNDDKSIFGTSAFYYKPMSQPLAQSIYQEMASLYSTDLYASDAGRASKAQRGYRFHPFSVTRVEDCPSVLVETGYITNDEECALLADASVRAKIAVAIANGIENYLRSK